MQAVVGASSHIPIVMFAVNFDPIERGYVTSLAQPGGNITGVVVRPLDFARKQIDLLRRTFPDRARLAVLYDQLTATSSPRPIRPQSRSISRYRRSSLKSLPTISLEHPGRGSGRAQLMMVLSSPAFSKRGTELAELAIKHRLPPCLPSGITSMLVD